MDSKILRAVTALIFGLAALAGPAAGQVASENGNVRQETVLTGDWESLRIGAGRVARPRCIAAFEEILADPRYRSRFPEIAAKFERPVTIALNPNGLNFQSEYYIFASPDGYELVVSCNIEPVGNGMRFTLAVEARPFNSYEGDNLASIVRSHLGWLKDRFALME